MSQINWQPDFLENEFVRLKPIGPNDFEILYAVASDPLIWEQHPSFDRYQRPVFQLFFDGALDSQTAFLIEDKVKKQIIGSTRFYDFQPENSSIAIGYTFLSRVYWGTKTNRMCKELLLNYAFQYVDKVYFHIGANNMRSQQAIKKIGAKKIQEIDFDHYGKPVLHVEYVMSKADWKALQG